MVGLLWMLILLYSKKIYSKQLNKCYSSHSKKTACKMVYSVEYTDFYEGIICFQNILRFRRIRLNIKSCTKLRISCTGTRKFLNRIMCRSVVMNFAQMEKRMWRGTDRNSFAPLRKTWFSLHWLPRNSQLLKNCLWTSRVSNIMQI